VELLVVIVIIAALAGLTAPMILKQARKADAAEAVSNGRQIGIAMFEFQAEYGSYPGTATIATVNTNNPGHGFTIATVTDANVCFRQLFAAGITQSEAMFYAKISGATKPDGDITATGDKAIGTGECGFGYILNATQGQTATGNPSRVIAATPMKTATTFNPDPFDKKAVLLRIDNSVVSVNIDTAGLAKIGGADVLSATASKFWGTVTPLAVLPTVAP
jgi:type II secretory pathway pseudopilin PulG